MDTGARSVCHHALILRRHLPRADIRNARKELREGTIDEAAYKKRVNEYMAYAIDVQEKVGLDVLVHGEPERSDMCANPPPPPLPAEHARASGVLVVIPALLEVADCCRARLHFSWRHLMLAAHSQSVLHVTGYIAYTSSCRWTAYPQDPQTTRPSTVVDITDCVSSNICSIHAVQVADCNRGSGRSRNGGLVWVQG